MAELVDFGRSFLDPETPLARIGKGELGGKAHGLALMREVLREHFGPSRFAGVAVDIPSLAVVCTDVFDEFIDRNRLREITQSDLSDDRISRSFQKGDLPFEILGGLRALVDRARTPLAVRSSSLLEDAKKEPFAGVYATKMVPNTRFDPDARFRQLVEAVKFVYASVYSRNAQDYRTATGHREEDEKMAVIVQELVGQRHHHRFYPELSGVARSYNYYPMGPARPEDGVVSLALGLGKTIVDGARCWSYSPAYPKVDPPFGSVEGLLKETQTSFWAVNMGEPPEYDPLRETEYLLQENLATAERDGTLQYLVSTYSPLSGRLSIGMGFEGPRALTFAPLLVLEQLPFNRLVRELLEVCSAALNSPVEIEFAVTFDPCRFRFLQVRAMEAPLQEAPIDLRQLQSVDVLVSTDSALGNGVLETLCDIVYTKPEAFDLKHTAAMVPELAQLNRGLLAVGRGYVLIVLGRLGTTDPWLGIPINWGRISGARVVVEATESNVRVELSQGSHFFHNLVSQGVKYFTLSLSSEHTIDWEWLARQEALEETRFFRHVRLPGPLVARVDGRSSRGVILKPRG